MRTRRVHVVVIAVAAALLAAPIAHAAPDDSLTLTSTDVPGLKAAGTGSKIAGSALGGRLPKALKGAQVRGSAFTGPGGQAVRAGVYVTTTGKVAAALKQARGKGFKKLSKTGAEAYRRTTTTKKSTTSIVVLRQDTAFAVVRFTISGRQPALAPSAAQTYAQTLAQRLQRVLQRSTFERVLDGIADDGSITPRLALEAFAIAYGPLPGVKRPAGPPGGPPSATEAMMLVARVWDKLTPAQRNAIDIALGAPHDSTSPPVARSAAPKLTPDPGYQVLVNKYVAIYAGKLPAAPPVDARVFRTNVELPDAKGVKAYADALPVNAAGKWGEGTPAYCRVRVPPYGQAQAKTPSFEFIIAHEVFHCFEFVQLPGWSDRNDWVMEGLADWAAATVYPAPLPIGTDAYKAYLLTPGKALFARSYDAVGFWGRADEHGGAGSMWAKIPGILGQPNEGQEALQAGVGQSGFDELWASATRRLAGAGAAWLQTLPYAIGSSTTPTPTKPLFNNGSLKAKAYALGEYTAFRNPARLLINVTGTSGSLRAGTGDADLGPLSQGWFCMGKCECPSGYESTIPGNDTVSGNKLELALTGGSTGGAGSVAYHAVKEFCSKKPKPKGPSGPAESNGDPHMTTFDGLHFDFQAAGEFLLAKSKSGDLQIQARQEPYEKSSTVTVNTQLAMRVGGRRVTVSPAAKESDPPVVRVDGVVDPLPGGTSKALGDGTLARESNARGYVDVTWADGSSIVVRPVGSWGVAMVIQLAGGRDGDVSGLLGNFDNDPADDLADRKGKRIKYTPKVSGGWEGLTRYKVKEEFEGTFFDALYDDFGDAWRVSQGESLFDYGPGQSTKTFTNKKVPTKPVDPAEVQRQRRAEAERICREHGVTQPGPLEDCITDVAATGNAAFADDAFAAQQAALVVWTTLRGGTQITGNLSTTITGDGVLHVGFTRGVAVGAARTAASIPINQTGGEGAEETVVAADADIGLFTAADGTAHAVSAEIPQNGDSSGVYHYARGPGGAWGKVGLVTGFGSSYAGAPSAIADPVAGQITVSPMAGVARVFRGATGAGNGVEVPVTAGCYATNAALARDSVSGAVFVAWRQWDCPQVGVFVAQIDPATGAFAGPPVQAPASSWTDRGEATSPDLNLDENLAFTGRAGLPGVFLAYPTGVDGNVALWRVGAPTPAQFPRRKIEARHVRIAADGAGGRVWVVWDESARLWVQRTTADGTTADGAARPAAPAPNPSKDALRLSDLQIAARGGGLDLVEGYRRGDTPGALYRARITP